MIISHKYKFIFIKTSKTAGTSIEVFLNQYLGENDIATPIYPPVERHVAKNYKGWFNPLKDLNDIIRSGHFKYWRHIFSSILRRKRYFHHIPAFMVANRVDTCIWNNYFKFCVERNPWDKFVSNFNMFKRRGIVNNLSEYLKKGNLGQNLSIYMSLDSQSILVDRVLRYENLDKELNEVFEKLGIPFSGQLSYKAKQNTKKKNGEYRKFIIENDLQELIEREFAREIKLFDYKFTQ